MTKSKPIAVLISDIHFTVPNLDLATAALSQAMDCAIAHDLPLVIAGDLLDSKAVIRAECANRLLDMFYDKDIPTNKLFILVGNHDRVNEKTDEHALNFLSGHAHIVINPYSAKLSGVEAFLIPYRSESEVNTLKLLGPRSAKLIICHQGIAGAQMGHYVTDTSSMAPSTFKDFRVVSGHYHRAQDIQTGPPGPNMVGTFSYIGSPYTQSFAEANDGPKGFRVLYQDGTLELVPTNLRKHVIIETMFDALMNTKGVKPGDLVWLKVKGTRAELDSLDKKEVGDKLFGHCDFKFDKIYLDEVEVKKRPENITNEDLLDQLVDETAESDEQKAELKRLWRKLA